MLQQNGKYLYASCGKRDGSIDSKILDLELLIKTALSMKRIPVIRQDRISAVHNKSVKNVPIDWKQYIDLSKTRILKVESGKIEELPDTLQYIYEQDFNLDSYSKNQVRHVGTDQLYDEENEQYPVIFLSKNTNIKRFRKIIPKSYINLNYTNKMNVDYTPSFLVILSMAQEVNDLTDIVLNYFGTTRMDSKLISEMLYSSIKLNSLYCPDWAKKKLGYYACLSLQHKRNRNITSRLIAEYTEVEKAIYQIHIRKNRNLPFYVNSSMISTHHLDFLKSMHAVYRYTDFKELKERFGEDEIKDHNLFYLVETNIMGYALVKIFPGKMNRFVFEGSWENTSHGLRKSLIQGINHKLKAYMNRFTKSHSET